MITNMFKKISLSFIVVSLMIIFAAPAEAKRNLAPGDCGADAYHLKEELANLNMLPRKKLGGPCLQTTAAHAMMAFQKWAKFPRTNVITPRQRQVLKKSNLPVQVKRKGPATRVEVWLKRQLVVLIRKRKVANIYSISSGQPGYSTPPGNFTVFRKEEMSWSVPYSVWMPWSSYFNGGIALHQSDSVPGYPASHGCVRVPASFAKRVYNFAGYGMPVIVR
jgi:lipoprotein-anchoring transpeptidase ErfK/SrfK